MTFHILAFITINVCLPFLSRGPLVELTRNDPEVFSPSVSMLIAAAEKPTCIVCV